MTLKQKFELIWNELRKHALAYAKLGIKTIKRKFIEMLLFGLDEILTGKM